MSNTSFERDPSAANGLGPLNSALAVMVDYLDNFAILDPAPAGTRDVAFRRSRVTLRTFAVILWTVTAGLCWISNPALIAKAVVRHRTLQANDG